MDKFVARLNIEHLTKLIADEKDEAKLKLLREMLAREEAILAQLMEKNVDWAKKS